jgi:glycosyltransferase involved in cell wall biosynthesis
MSRKLLMVTTVASTLNAFLLPFADHFRSRGWTVDAAAADITGDLTCASHFDRTWEVGWSRSPLTIANVGAIRTVRRVVRAGGYDLVHVHTPVAGFVTRYALREARRAGGPMVVYTAHGLHSYPGGRPLSNAVFCALERLAGRWTDAMVVINRDDAAYALRHHLTGRGVLLHMPGIGVDLIEYARDSIDAADVAAARSDVGLESTDRMLLMAAEFNPRKRHADALRAFARLQEPDARLVLVGEGPLRERMIRLASELGITRRVRFPGRRSDMPALLVGSAALVLPSVREGLPRVVLEAMAAGTPVIGCRIRGTSELLEGGCGLLFEPGDVEGLTAAMRSVLDDGFEAEARARLARERVEAYALPRVLELHEELYERLLRPRADVMRSGLTDMAAVEGWRG